MNDDDMLTAVRECLTAARDRVAGEQLARPAGEIIGRARRRRLLQGLSTTTVTAAIVAVAVLALLLPGSAGNDPTPVRLAAWTVIQKPGGLVRVTIRELRDPAGLQRRLRADGVWAIVRFERFIPHTQIPRRIYHPCYYRAGHDRLVSLLSRIFPVGTRGGDNVFLTINPSAIPAGAGLWIEISLPSAREGRPEFTTFSPLVYANGRCPFRKAG